ncbi:MAG: hypothetical protein ACKOBP_09635 [Planctomycetia bacterium]
MREDVVELVEIRPALRIGWTVGLVAVACCGLARAEEDAEPAHSRRVDVALTAKGELHGPATGSKEGARQPIAMEGRFRFVETLEPPGADAVAVRQYAQAEATLEADGGTQSLALPADARRIAVARLGTTPQPYLPTAHLSRDELELLETPFDSVLLEDLLPGRPVAADDHWPLTGDLAAGLLAIDTVEAGTLEARIVEIANGRARIALEGVVDGAVDGVPTHVVVDGEFMVAAEPDEDGFVLTGDVTQLDAVVKERRQASHVAAGFEIEATVALARAPADEPIDDETADEADLAEDADTDAAADSESDATLESPRRRGEGRPGLVWYRDPDGRYDIVHEAAWRCVGEDAGGLVLRLLDLGALVAQCSITALPGADDATPPTVDEVKRNVEQSLAGQFKRFDGVRETVREDDGVRVVRLVSEGVAEGLPFRWIHYVLTDDAGRRVHATFMVEASLEKRFASADERLVAGLRFAAEPTREARLPSKTVVP